MCTIKFATIDMVVCTPLPDELRKLELVVFGEHIHPLGGLIQLNQTSLQVSRRLLRASAEQSLFARHLLPRIRTYLAYIGGLDGQ